MFSVRYCISGNNAISTSFTTKTHCPGGDAFLYWGHMLEHLSDLNLYGLMIAAEAANQPLEGQIAVAHVPLTRLQMRPWRYGRTLREVLLMPSAFSCFNDSAHWQRFLSSVDRFAMMAELIHHVPNPMPNATHYYNPKLATPYWVSKFEKIGVIADHIFMREPS